MTIWLSSQCEKYLPALTTNENDDIKLFMSWDATVRPLGSFVDFVIGFSTFSLLGSVSRPGKELSNLELWLNCAFPLSVNFIGCARAVVITASSLGSGKE